MQTHTDKAPSHGDISDREALDKLATTLHGKPIHKRMETVMRGNIAVYAFGEYGEYGEFVVWTSLTNALGISRSALNGRYIRHNIQSISVLIPTGKSKPIRAFSYELLGDVLTVLTTGKGVFTGESDATVASINIAHVPIIDGTPFIDIEGEYWLTLASITHYYGVSEKTARRRLTAAGLLDKFEPHPRLAGAVGRHRHALSSGYAPHVQAAMSWRVTADQLEQLVGTEPEVFTPAKQLLALKENYRRIKVGLCGDPIELQSIIDEYDFHIRQAEKALDLTRADDVARQVVNETKHPAATPTPNLIAELNAIPERLAGRE